MAGDYFHFQYPQAAQGWQCPICKHVYAPFVTACFGCGITTFTSSSNTTAPDYSMERRLEEECPHLDTMTICTDCGHVMDDGECAEPTPPAEEAHTPTAAVWVGKKNPDAVIRAGGGEVTT